MNKTPSPYLRLSLFIAVIMLFLGFAALWRWTELGSWLNPEHWQHNVAWLREHPLAPLFGIGGFLLATLLALPATLVMLAEAVIFGAHAAFFYVCLGALLNAVLSFSLGRWLGASALAQLPASRAHKLSERLGQGGLMAALTIRLLPIAPFVVMNVLIGASHIRFQHFLLSTILILIPHTLAMVVFADNIQALLAEPQLKNVLWLLLAAVVFLAIAWFGRRLRLKENTVKNTE